MTEVRFQPEPTFEAPVPIYVPGKGDLQLRWTFKYRDSSEVGSFVRDWLHVPERGETKSKSSKRRTEAQDSTKPMPKVTTDPIGYVMAFAVGWELDEEFSKENLSAFFLRYPQAALDVARIYYAELSGARRKNY